LEKKNLIMLDDGSEVKKSGLLSAKLNTLPEETFLECHDCHGRVHKVCALANSRKVRSGNGFLCPKCVLVRRADDADTEIENRESARNLPHCKMSNFMEAGLLKSLDDAYAKAAVDDGKSVEDIERASGLSVRVISHVRKKHSVRDEVSPCSLCTFVSIISNIS
jgi:hypothetical protein